MSSAHPASSRKMSKIQICFLFAKKGVDLFPEGENPLCAGGRSPEALASRKVASREAYTEGSETAKSGTDEQKRNTEA